MNRLDFSTIQSSDNYTHYINVVVLAQFFQPSIIYLKTGDKNASMELQDWVPITINNITEAYTAQVIVPDGTIQITHANSKALMTAISYGFTERGCLWSPRRAQLN